MTRCAVRLQGLHRQLPKLTVNVIYKMLFVGWLYTATHQARLSLVTGVNRYMWYPPPKITRSSALLLEWSGLSPRNSRGPVTPGTGPPPTCFHFLLYVEPCPYYGQVARYYFSVGCHGRRECATFCGRRQGCEVRPYGELRRQYQSGTPGLFEEACIPSSTPG